MIQIHNISSTPHCCINVKCKIIFYILKYFWMDHCVCILNHFLIFLFVENMFSLLTFPLHPKFFNSLFTFSLWNIFPFQHHSSVWKKNMLHFSKISLAVWISHVKRPWNVFCMLWMSFVRLKNAREMSCVHYGCSKTVLKTLF